MGAPPLRTALHNIASQVVQILVVRNIISTISEKNLTGNGFLKKNAFFFAFFSVGSFFFTGQCIVAVD